MLEVVLLTVFPALMAYAAASDLVTMTIPNRVSLILVLAFAALALLAGFGWAALTSHAAAGLLVLAAAFGLFAAGWMGGGDAKLAAATALWFGFDELGAYLILSALAGGALTLAILAMRRVHLPRFALGWDWLERLHDRNNGVPYGIALAGAGLMVFPHSPVWTAIIGG